MLPSKVFRPGVRPPEQRVEDFEEVELPFTSWQAKHEAQEMSPWRSVQGMRDLLERMHSEKGGCGGRERES